MIQYKSFVFCKLILSYLISSAFFSNAFAQSNLGFSAKELSGKAIVVGKSLNAEDDCEDIRKGLANRKVSFVQIKPGTYVCSKPIFMDQNNKALIGLGNIYIDASLATSKSNDSYNRNSRMNSVSNNSNYYVTIRLKNNTNAPLLVMGTDGFNPKYIVDNIYVENLILDGNRQNQTMECWSDDCDKTEKSAIRNNSITVRGVSNATIKNCYLLKARSGGLVTEKYVRNLHVNGLISEDHHYDGFAGYVTEDSLLENLLLRNNQGAGISLDIRFNNNIFRKSTIINNRDVGIFAREVEGNYFENINIENNGNHSVFLARSGKTLETCAMRNTFKSITLKENKGAGFRLNDSCPDNLIIDSQFINNKSGDLSEVIKGQLILLKSEQ